MKKIDFISKNLFMRLAIFALFFVAGSALVSAQSAQSQFQVITPGTPFFGVSAAYYQVNLTAGRLTVYTQGSSDTEITIYDSKAQRLAYDDDSGVDYNARVTINVTAGTYFIRITYADGSGPYVLNVER
jgi:hypothetical protein